ncbi:MULTISPECIES: hypothetical protein [unclassified Crossiella]|uniref:hypothetical protein n=1 Tax=unclassified Crossiella TaxID=2620835 RepID=UPI001FFF3A11|nr:MULTISPECIES: hypothetical protein [unclassified Crossiella]MCK2244722.1 hypothetical protein [Crossiella sp. S99.2]MCK2258280.1 hypothetical protein [Crossiella sp. S99.1]
MTAQQVLTRIAAGLVTVGVIVLIFKGCAANLRSSGATVYEFFRAVAVNSPTACRLLSGAALTKFQARANAESCEQAVAKVSRGLSTPQFEQLLKGEVDVLEYHSGIRPDFSSRVEIHFGPNPLGMEVIVLAEHNGRETISDWGWEIRELS